MLFYSTNNPQLRVSFKEAVMKGLPDDNGLFMPVEISALPDEFFRDLKQYSFQEIAYTVSKNLIRESIPEADLHDIIQKSMDFPVPVVRLDDNAYVLELFHGPSLAFKDFGARFMAQTMSWLNRGEDKELTILVATSGDTGGAVAAGFFQTPGIRVVILYPSGKVSPLQEKQLTTLGHNVTALEVHGTFDDCQALVKKAFLDTDVTRVLRLSSANSINIARLIPQSFYYFEAYKQLMPVARPVVFSIPSGNFGNLTAGLLAQRTGLPVHRFIAATNANDVVPAYLTSGTYSPRPSVRTLSNAMDVGAPSNFARMLDLHGSTWNMMRESVVGFGFSDEETSQAMRDVDQQFGYIMDPHGAVGYLALKAYQRQEPGSVGVILETAHPAKFVDDVERILGHGINIPERLSVLEHKQKVSIEMQTDYAGFKDWLLRF